MDWNAVRERLQQWLLIDGAWGWIVQVFVVVLLVLAVNFVQRRALRRLHKKLTDTHNPWDDALVAAMQRPLSLLIWVVGMAFAADIVATASEAPIFAAVGPLRDIGVIVALSWFLIRAAHGVEANLIAARQAADPDFDRTSFLAVGKLTRSALMITAALVALQTLGFSISGVLAFGGIGGIAVGFAARDVLANFFGGLMVYLDRPFSVGDWVRSPDRNIEGTVEDIGWRTTRIRTFDKRPLYVPNSVFASIAVENPSRMSHRRIYEAVGLRYDDAGKVATIAEAIRQMLRDHPDIAGDQTLMVNLNAFGPSSLDLFIYCFTHTTVWADFHDIKEDVLLKIEQIVAAHGAEIAFPTTTVHLPQPEPDAA